MQYPYQSDTIDRIYGNQTRMRLQEVQDELDRQAQEQAYWDAYARGEIVPELRATPYNQTIDYLNAHPRAWGDPMRAAEPIVNERDVHPVVGAFNNAIFGYQKGERMEPSNYDVQGWMEYDPYANYQESEGLGWKDLGYLVPGVGQAMFAKDVVDDVREGNTPGMMDAAFAMPFFRGVGRLGKRAISRAGRNLMRRPPSNPRLGYNKVLRGDVYNPNGEIQGYMQQQVPRPGFQQRYPNRQFTDVDYTKF